MNGHHHLAPGLIDSAATVFLDTVLAPTAPLVQRMQMRRAFYGGTGAVVAMLEEIGRAGGPTALTALFAQLNAELTRYRADVKAGRA